MIDSVFSPKVEQALQNARARRSKKVRVAGREVAVPVPFPSPADWRDPWIYFLMLDRFNNPEGPPNAPWDSIHGGFQGGTLKGVTERLDYIQGLGAGALWLSPVFKNCPEQDGTYHGYGIQDFLAVDPRFGSGADLEELVTAAHARGLYVILDVVLNHTGNVFAYRMPDGSLVDSAGWNPGGAWPVAWRDAESAAQAEWNSLEAVPEHPDTGVWPKELRHDARLRRRGMSPPWDERQGDFAGLKELVTDAPARDALIRAYQYAIARYDVDGFRIDTLKHVEPDFARVFGNAMREYALSIGKRDFFTFGEIAESGDEAKIARFIGRGAADASDLIGVDAALDFPLFHHLAPAAKGADTPLELAAMFERRKAAQRGHISSHGEAARFFVTFLDNHDLHARFGFLGEDHPERYAHQVSLALACLFSLQGIPCVYYGTEQGLDGHDGAFEAVREALWGQPGAFGTGHPVYQELRAIAALRAERPELRYGRQYFRPVSGDEGRTFGISEYPDGMLAFSRILSDREVLVAANLSTTHARSLEVLVDAALNAKADTTWGLLYSNQKPSAATPGPLRSRPGAWIRQADGSVSNGTARALPVALNPMEVQILAPV